MASIGRSAPLQQQTPKSSALVEDPDFQELVERSRSLALKILQSIPDTHKSCIHSQNTLQLNSPDNLRFEFMANSIGIPPTPVVTPVSENFSLNTSLKNMSEGLHQFSALLSTISERLQNKNKVVELMSDIKDLTIQINKMQKMLHRDSVVQSTPAPVSLHIDGHYEVQLAAHLTLVKLQSFGQDIVRCLRSLDCSEDENTES
ncbi:colony stimulating factor 3 (granulocyte) a isoform X2 [Cynoglossus semilaevis]|uniref:Uncharacterized LOC103381749 n=2 Tax=Cynoglossus semilaevis TaxID=244447 RepID=A0A3P8VZR8_CYNSE|nr:uncharacterized protein LOC103381749 isoform X2 [Cynoglossus semilaevis]